jgi:hypothetical protein
MFLVAGFPCLSLSSFFPLVKFETIKYLQHKEVRQALFLQLEDKIDNYSEMFQKIELTPNKIYRYLKTFET